MELELIAAETGSGPARRYIAAITLKTFHGRDHVEAQLFRAGGTGAELEELRAFSPVGPPAPDMPPELLQGASEEAALACLLEAFTREESDALAQYLQERYADQLEKLVICPLDLPVPLGVGPLAQIPESASSGIIHFDLAPEYPLPFRLKGYYDLTANRPDA